MPTDFCAPLTAPSLRSLQLRLPQGLFRAASTMRERLPDFTLTCMTTCTVSCGIPMVRLPSSICLTSSSFFLSASTLRERLLGIIRLTMTRLRTDFCLRPRATLLQDSGELLESQATALAGFLL